MTMYWFVELGPTFSYIQRFSNDQLSQVMLTTLFYSFVYSFTQQIFTLIEEIWKKSTSLLFKTNKKNLYEDFHKPQRATSTNS